MDARNKPLLTFRVAEPEDCALILRFINDLAVYEKMADDVVATEATLMEWIFEKRAAEVIFAVVDGAEVAFAVFCHNFSTFVGRAGLYLEDVYVQPEHRGCGIGKAILRELARIAVSRGYGRMEWVCLDWNTPSIEFYMKLGATALSDWTTYRLAGEELAKLAND